MYYIGQRVICGREIGVVASPNKNGRYDDGPFDVWVTTSKGTSSYAAHNVKPLPNGQL